jgi:AhpD family alkylhydroperoxidase
MCDEKAGAENSEDRFGTGDRGVFDRCAPMMKSMFGEFREMMGRAPKDSPAQAAGATGSVDSRGTVMSGLQARERELVALGAAMGSNCVPCIEYHVPKARKAGLTDAQIRSAIRLADEVRKVPARKVLDAALQLLPDDALDAPSDPDTPPRSRGATPPAEDGACCG